MDLSKILSIAGKPGLYQIINQTRGGVLAISLLDGKKTSIGQTQRVSTLSDISIYTEAGDEPLMNILQTMYKTSDGKPFDTNVKDDDALRNLMREILPEHDEERVYTSDIRKVVKWYNLLLKSDLIDLEKAPEEETEEEKKSEESKTEKSANEGEPAKKKAPTKKTPAKKTTSQKAPLQKAMPKAGGASKNHTSSKKG